MLIVVFSGMQNWLNCKVTNAWIQYFDLLSVTILFSLNSLHLQAWIQGALLGTWSQLWKLWYYLCVNVSCCSFSYLHSSYLVCIFSYMYLTFCTHMLRLLSRMVTMVDLWMEWCKGLGGKIEIAEEKKCPWRKGKSDFSFFATKGTTLLVNCLKRTFLYNTWIAYEIVFPCV